MAYNDSNLLTDLNSRIIPCYYNTATGLFEPIEGKNGATNIRMKNGGDVALGHTDDPVANSAELGEPYTAISLLKAGCKNLEDRIAAQMI